MTYSQEEVDLLIEEREKELFKELEKLSFEERKILHKKGKLLSYGLHLHLIPKHKFNKLKQK